MRPWFSAKLRGDKSAIKMEKIRRRTVGHVKTPPRPTSSRRAGARRTRASTSGRAPEPEPEQDAQPQPEAVEAPAPVATPSEVQNEAKQEELRPLEQARALYLARKAEREMRENRAKEGVALAEAKSPGAAAPDEPAEGESAVSRAGYRRPPTLTVPCS